MTKSRLTKNEQIEVYKSLAFSYCRPPYNLDKVALMESVKQGQWDDAFVKSKTLAKLKTHS